MSKNQKLRNSFFVLPQRISTKKVTNLCCNFCGKIFSSQRSLSVHVSNQHDVKKAIKKAKEKKPVQKTLCNLCGVSISCPARAKLHAETEHGNNECKICGYKTTRMRDHLAHMRGAHRPVCDRCKLPMFKTPHACPAETGPGCLTSEQMADVSQRVTKHPRIRGLSSVDAFICLDCGLQGPTVSMLKQHQDLVHAGVAPAVLLAEVEKVTCKICRCVFSSTQKLARHVRNSHEKVKTEKCPYCGAMFSEKFILTEHIKRVHTNERNIRCELCDYKTNTNSRLALHMRSHRNVTKYCKFPGCLFGTDSIGAMVRHNKNVHGIGGDWSRAPPPPLQEETPPSETTPPPEPNQQMQNLNQLGNAGMDEDLTSPQHPQQDVKTLYAI